MRALWALVVAGCVLGASAPPARAMPSGKARIDRAIVHALPNVRHHATRSSLAPFVAVERLELVAPRAVLRAVDQRRSFAVPDLVVARASARGPPRA